MISQDGTTAPSYWWFHGSRQRRTFWRLVSRGLHAMENTGISVDLQQLRVVVAIFIISILHDERTEVQKGEVIHPKSLEKLV